MLEKAYVYLPLYRSWPAVREKGDPWTNDVLDILEGVNSQGTDEVSLHTASGRCCSRIIFGDALKIGRTVHLRVYNAGFPSHDRVNKFRPRRIHELGI